MSGIIRVTSNKLYIDYLDHNVSGFVSNVNTTLRLRFDLLLFSEEILCLSVPACVKLDSTTDILMKLTPFWKANRIKIILDKKHQNNPWNYFKKRKQVLERGFNERDLLKHFEYAAYTSPHTSYFYDVYVPEIIRIPKDNLFIDKIFDTDEIFRQSMITQVNDNADIICSNMSIHDNIHMGKIFNELNLISEDRKTLFQRTAIENKLVTEFGASLDEISIVSRMLDKGFAYANGISTYAAPLSLVTNRLTGISFMKIIQSIDPELFDMIRDLCWDDVFTVSKSILWTNFIDHLNRLLVLYQDSEKRKDELFTPFQVEISSNTIRLITKIYESAIESLQIELLKIGCSAIDILNLKNYSDTLLDQLLYNRHEYWDIIKEVDELFYAIKMEIRSIGRKYKGSTQYLRDQGFLVNINSGQL